MARIGDDLSGGTRREIFQAKVDADRAAPGRAIVFNLAYEVQIPPAARILTEATAPNISWDRSRQPHAIWLAEHRYGVAANFDRPRALKRHPPKGALRSKTDTPPRPTPRLVAADGESLANRLNHIAMQSKFSAASVGQADQIKPRRPAAIEASAVVGDLPAIIPNLVHRNCHLRETFFSARVLDSVSESEVTMVSQWRLVHVRRLGASSVGSALRFAFMPPVLRKSKSAIPPRPEGRGFSRRFG